MFHVIKEKTSSRQKVAKNVGFFVFLMRLRSVVISCLNHENSCSCGPYGKWKELKLNCESRFYELFGEASLLLNILHATTKNPNFPYNHEKMNPQIGKNFFSNKIEFSSQKSTVNLVHFWRENSNDYNETFCNDFSNTVFISSPYFQPLQITYCFLPKSQIGL